MILKFGNFKKHVLLCEVSKLRTRYRAVSKLRTRYRAVSKLRTRYRAVSKLPELLQK